MCLFISYFLLSLLFCFSLRFPCLFLCLYFPITLWVYFILYFFLWLSEGVSVTLRWAFSWLIGLSGHLQQPYQYILFVCTWGNPDSSLSWPLGSESATAHSPDQTNIFNSQTYPHSQTNTFTHNRTHSQTYSQTHLKTFAHIRRHSQTHSPDQTIFIQTLLKRINYSESCNYGAIQSLDPRPYKILGLHWFGMFHLIQERRLTVQNVAQKELHVSKDPPNQNLVKSWPKA